MLINVALAVMLLLGFAGFWLYDRSRKAPFIFFLATSCFLISATMGLCTPYVPVGAETLFRFVLNSINLIAGALLTCGVVLHYKLNPYWGRMALFVIFGMVVIFAVLEMPRQSVLRLSLNQTPIVISLLIGAFRLYGVEKRTIIDNLLMVVLSIFSLNLAARPVILALNGTMGSTIAEYQETQYAIIVQFSLALIIIATATILMLVLISDLVHDLRRQGQRDYLTGLTNRKGFNKRANNLLQRATQSNSPVTLVMCDIDHFKSINDTHGHLHGDRVITFFGKLLSNITLSKDIAARVGGEEFCLLLWNNSLEEGFQICEDIRTAFHATAMPFPTGDQNLSASFGITHHEIGESLQDIYERADSAMYKAKSNGRNCVCVANSNAPIISNGSYKLNAA